MSSAPVVAVDEMGEQFPRVVLMEAVAPPRVALEGQVALENVAEGIEAEGDGDELSQGLVVGPVVAMDPNQGVIIETSGPGRSGGRAQEVGTLAIADTGHGVMDIEVVVSEKTFGGISASEQGVTEGSEPRGGLPRTAEELQMAESGGPLDQQLVLLLEAGAEMIGFDRDGSHDFLLMCVSRYTFFQNEW